MGEQHLLDVELLRYKKSSDLIVVHKFYLNKLSKDESFLPKQASLLPLSARFIQGKPSAQKTGECIEGWVEWQPGLSHPCSFVLSNPTLFLQCYNNLKVWTNSNHIV